MIKMPYKVNDSRNIESITAEHKGVDEKMWIRKKINPVRLKDMDKFIDIQK